METGKSLIEFIEEIKQSISEEESVLLDKLTECGLDVGKTFVYLVETKVLQFDLKDDSHD